jgi:hypothetical protein
MANRFIPYIPKSTIEKQSIKPHCKGNWQIERGSVLVKACTVLFLDFLAGIQLPYSALIQRQFLSTPVDHLLTLLYALGYPGS